MNRLPRGYLALLAILISVACYSVAQSVYTPTVQFTVENRAWARATVSIYCSGTLFRRIARLESGETVKREFSIGHCQDARIGIRLMGQREWYSEVILIPPESDVTIIVPNTIQHTLIRAI